MITGETQHKAPQERDIGMRDLVLRLRDWCRFLWKKRLIIIIVGLIGGALGLFLAFTDKPVYTGKLTFVLEESKSNPLSAYAGLASQFGVDLGSGGGIGVFSGDNILEFLKSRLMIEQTLLSGIGVRGKETSLAELYIDMYQLRKGWEKNEQLRNISFAVNANSDRFSRPQDSILDVIYDRITRLNLKVSKPDKKLSFIAVECTSPNEIFSKFFTEKLVKEATDFYVETRIKRSRTNVDLLQAKADSLEKLLNRKTYSVAAAEDVNQNPARKVATVGMEVGSRDKLVIQTIYGEVIKNLELSRMTMAQEMPLIQVVDKPVLPLRKKKLGKIKGTLLGGIIGGFLICGFLVVVESYRRITTF